MKKIKYLMVLVMVSLLCSCGINSDPDESEIEITKNAEHDPLHITDSVPASSSNDVLPTESKAPTAEPTQATELTHIPEPTQIAEPTPTAEPIPTGIPRTPLEEITSDQYVSYSNEKVAWSFRREKEHKQSGTYEPFNINEYNAYYINSDATQDDKVIYLTFDCGYENGFTPTILDVLDKHDAKAMFFVTKYFVNQNVNLVKRMKEEGHMVGNHTLNHPSLPTLTIDKLKDEIIGAEDLMKEQTGYELDMFIRPPMGEYSERTLKITEDLGYATIFWSIAYLDFDPDNQPGKDYVVSHFKEYHHNGAIPLIHNISQSNTEALDDVLTYLKAEGYRFGTLDELVD